MQDLELNHRQRVLLSVLKKQGVIKEREALLTKSARSLEILATYGLVTFTTEGFCLSAKGVTTTKEWA